jgi:hypothetical protein
VRDQCAFGSSGNADGFGGRAGSDLIVQEGDVRVIR